MYILKIPMFFKFLNVFGSPLWTGFITILVNLVVKWAMFIAL